MKSAAAADSPAKLVGGRAQARMKAAEVKSALAERRKLDEDLNKHERRLEAIEREFRQLFGVGRTKLMGKDRFFNRYWWLDGMGAGQLVTSNGSTAYGTGRLFVQGPNPFDLDIIASKGEGVVRARQSEEDGEGGPLKPGQWAVYSEPQDIESLVAWLNVKGHRELSLKNQLSKWMDHIMGGIRRRQSVSFIVQSGGLVLTFGSVGPHRASRTKKYSRYQRLQFRRRKCNPRVLSGLDQSQHHSI